jgi:hypothetical protein
MIGPLDTQVLVNRTLDVQKIQGNVTQTLEDEEKNNKERVAKQVITEEQRVQRKSEIIPGKIKDQDRRQESNSDQDKERKTKDKASGTKTSITEKSGPAHDRNEWRGRFVDLEL